MPTEPRHLFGSLRTQHAACVLPGAEPTAKPQPLPVNIRWMVRRDLPDVLNMELLCFPDGPWSEEEFTRCLRQRNVIGMVADTTVFDGEYHGDVVCAYMIYELHPHKLHLLNFAVHPTYQRRAVGSQMVAKLASKLTVDRRNRILLEVRESNLPAQLFFKSQQFRAQSVLRDYWDTGEDAYLMQRRFSTTPDHFPHDYHNCRGK